MLDHGAEREGGEEGQAGDDHHDADHQTAEERAVGGKGAGGDRDPVLAGERSGDGERRDDEAEPAEQHREPLRGRHPRRGGVEATERGAVVVTRRGEGVEDLAETVRAGILDRVVEDRAEPEADRGEPEHGDGHRHQVEHDELHLGGLDLLAQVLRRPPDHQAGEEHGEQGVDEQPHQPDPDAPRADLTEEHVEQGDATPAGGHRVVHAVHPTVRRPRGGGRPGVHVAGPNRTSLPSERPARLGRGHRLVDAEGREPRIAVRLGHGGDDHRREPQADHHGEEHVALAAVLGHAAVGDGHREGQHDDEPLFEQAGPPGGVLERVGGVRVEEAAAVGPELLDGDLGGGRPAREVLGDARHAGDVGVAGEVLDHPLTHEQQGGDERQGHEDPDDDADQVDPEVAERGRSASGDAADQGGDHPHPRGGRHEVLHGQTRHLGEVTHRHLAAVGLPVGVGDETDRGVEHDGRVDARHALGVEGQAALESKECVEGEHRDEAEGEQRGRVAGPPLFGRRVDAARAVDGPFGRSEDAVARRRARLAVLVGVTEHGGEVAPEGRHRDDEEDEEDPELEQAGRRHQNRSGNTRVMPR